MKSAVRVLEDEMIRDTLDRFKQNKSRTARFLGISRQSLIKKLRRISVHKKNPDTV
jgi:DNA-binding NtrC family response regulator